MRILAIGPGDGAWLAALHRACFPDDAWDADAWASLLAQPGVRGAALVEADEPIGFVLVRHAADEAEILTIGVAPGRRRAGCGRRLLDHAVAGLPADVATVHLEVAVDNPAALALYGRSGFAPVGRRRGYYRRRDGSVDALMLSLVRANGLSGNWKSDAGPGNHGRETPERV
ncbi:GNAT family N-acetyltransferase [Stella sp.]|uniref:GNAT family N-acetyltransferase n=1 Tax=Stella sp. TaxID=2912054 RepID=UPI0035B234A1